LQSLVKQKKTRVSKVSPEAMAVLVRHRWPGNVRELENVIYRSAVIAQGDAILVNDLPVEIRGSVAPDAAAETTAETPAESRIPATPTLAQALDVVFEQLKTGTEPILPRIERELVARALAAEGGDEAKAARLLGLPRMAVQKRAKEA